MRHGMDEEIGMSDRGERAETWGRVRGRRHERDGRDEA